MAQTYRKIQKQIENLQRQAERLRAVETKGVVDRIKVAIAHYGLTAEQLGLAGSPKGSQRKLKGKAAKCASTAAKYSDGNGKVWSGRGPRPHWLRNALNAGRSLEEFRAGAQEQHGAPEAGAPASAGAKKAVRKAKRAPAIRFRDDAGNTWSGRGPRPAWIRAALDAGKTIEEFAAK